MYVSLGMKRIVEDKSECSNKNIYYTDFRD